MTTLIAIPCGPNITGQLIDKAVKHALAQTADVVVMVIGDGVRPPVSVSDDRLIVRSFPVNRGAPFVQQAMILGSPFAWYAPHGADDWIEPNHVSSLLALRSPVNGSGVIWYHRPGNVQLMRSHRTYIEFGVLDTALLRSIGGYNPTEPCGQDSVVITLLTGTSPFALSRYPTYHKVYRPDSLTQHPDTRSGSAVRTAVRLRNRATLVRCQRLGWRNRPAIKAYRDGLVPPGLRTELEDRAADVAKWLS